MSHAHHGHGRSVVRRNALWLRVLADGYTPADLAEMSGCDVRTIRDGLQRARLAVPPEPPDDGLTDDEADALLGTPMSDEAFGRTYADFPEAVAWIAAHRRAD
jgi:hypothetical protein